MVLKSFIFKSIFYLSILIFGFFGIPSLLNRTATRMVVYYWAKIMIISLEKIVGIKIFYKNSLIKRNKGYLIAANHQSIFETIFFLKEFDKVIYVVKKELKFIPVYGWYASRMGHIFLDRKKRIISMKILSKSVKKYIKDGYKVIIFPEGTRQEKNTIGNIKPGIFSLQKDMDNLVHPIFINSGETWPRSGSLKRKNINIKVLAPLKRDFSKRIFLDKLKTVLEAENKKYIKYD